VVVSPYSDREGRLPAIPEVSTRTPRGNTGRSPTHNATTRATPMQHRTASRTGMKAAHAGTGHGGSFTSPGGSFRASTAATSLAADELASLKRAGESAQNVLAQMLDDSSDFAHRLAVATNGGGTDTASRSIRLAQAAAQWEQSHHSVVSDSQITAQSPTAAAVLFDTDAEASAPGPHAAAATPAHALNTAETSSSVSMQSPTAAAATPAAARPTPAAVAATPRVPVSASRSTVDSSTRRASLNGGLPPSAMKKSTRRVSVSDPPVDAADGSGSRAESGVTQVSLPTGGVSPRSAAAAAPACSGLRRACTRVRYFCWNSSWRKVVSNISDSLISPLIVMGYQHPRMKLSPLLRSLSVRVAAALLILLTLQTTVAVLNDLQVVKATYTASSINVASYRRELAITAAFQARELVLGPDIIGTSELAVVTMREYTDSLARYHRALLLGDEELRLRGTLGTDPAQDALLNRASANAFKPINTANATEYEVLEAKISEMGLDYLIMAFIDLCNSFLARYEPYFSNDNDLVNRLYKRNVSDHSDEYAVVDFDYSQWKRHNLTTIMEDFQYRQLENVGFRLLDDKLKLSVSLYAQQVDASSTEATTVQIVIYLVNLAVILLLQQGVFSTQFANLAAEAQRTQEFVRLLPVPVLESVPKLRTFLAGRA
jgi:hypothetical protein